MRAAAPRGAVPADEVSARPRSRERADRSGSRERQWYHAESDDSLSDEDVLAHARKKLPDPPVEGSQSAPEFKRPGVKLPEIAPGRRRGRRRSFAASGLEGRRGSLPMVVEAARHMLASEYGHGGDNGTGPHAAVLRRRDSLPNGVKAYRPGEEKVVAAGIREGAREAALLEAQHWRGVDQGLDSKWKMVRSPDEVSPQKDESSDDSAEDCLVDVQLARAMAQKEAARAIAGTRAAEKDREHSDRPKGLHNVLRDRKREQRRVPRQQVYYRDDRREGQPGRRRSKSVVEATANEQGGGADVANRVQQILEANAADDDGGRKWRGREHRIETTAVRQNGQEQERELEPKVEGRVAGREEVVQAKGAPKAAPANATQWSAADARNLEEALAGAHGDDWRVHARGLADMEEEAALLENADNISTLMDSPGTPRSVGIYGQGDAASDSEEPRARLPIFGKQTPVADGNLKPSPVVTPPVGAVSPPDVLAIMSPTSPSIDPHQHWGTAEQLALQQHLQVAAATKK